MIYGVCLTDEQENMQCGFCMYLRRDVDIGVAWGDADEAGGYNAGHGEGYDSSQR